jgi:two-component system, OmpR family, response regulator
VTDRASTSADPAPGRHILVVDDEAVIRDTLGELLEIDGYLVETAQDGLDALRHLRERRPDALVLDLMLPDLNGWDVLRVCRADPMLTELPVIVMSARPDVAQSVAEFDVQACLTKPFDFDELLDALAEMWAD